MESIEAIIIGGGQAGLATSYRLKKLGREHVIFEAADQPAHAWRDDRWFLDDTTPTSSSTKVTLSPKCSSATGPIPRR